MTPEVATAWRAAATARLAWLRAWARTPLDTRASAVAVGAVLTAVYLLLGGLDWMVGLAGLVLSAGWAALQPARHSTSTSGETAAVVPASREADNPEPDGESTVDSAFPGDWPMPLVGP